MFAKRPENNDDGEGGELPCALFSSLLYESTCWGLAELLKINNFNKDGN